LKFLKTPGIGYSIVQELSCRITGLRHETAVHLNVMLLITGKQIGLNSWSKFILEKLIVPHLVKKFLSFN
jgi:hypothetical protein